MLKAGTAVVDITPAPGSLMAAFPVGAERIPRRALGAHDPLRAKVVVLDDGSTSVALVVGDVCGFRRVDVARIRSRVGEELPELAAHMVLAASHSHSSLENNYLFGNTPDDPFILEVDRRIADAVVQAHACRQPATVAFTSVRVPLNYNRRVRDSGGRVRGIAGYRAGVTEGPTDPELAVLRLKDPDGTDRAVIFRYTAHALTVGPGNLFYSADFPGQAAAVIEKAHPGCTALFLNGAAGNVHPRECMRPDFVLMEKVGNELGRAVLASLDGARELLESSLAFSRCELCFPNRADANLMVDVEVSALAVGPVLFGFAPGEMFVEFQLRFIRELAPSPAVFVGYADGWPGYVPTRESYAEGGYGVDLQSGDPPRYSRTALPPGAGEIITTRLCALARGLRGDAR